MVLPIHALKVSSFWQGPTLIAALRVLQKTAMTGAHNSGETADLTLDRQLLEPQFTCWQLTQDKMLDGNDTTQHKPAILVALNSCSATSKLKPIPIVNAM